MGPRLVRGGEDDPAPDQDRFPLQRRVEELLDRGEERIEIGVENRGLSHAPSMPGCWDRKDRLTSGTRRHLLQCTPIDLAQMGLGKTVDEVDAARVFVCLEMGEGPVGQLGLSDIGRHYEGDRLG